MTQEEILAWLQGGGSLEDIFGPPGSGGMPYVPVTDPDDAGTTDGMRDTFNMLQDGNDLMSDNATFAQIGMGAGGVRPQDFEPKITYESVKAPAFLKLRQMQGSNDPVSQIIARVMLEQRGTALQAEDAVLAAFDEGLAPPRSLKHQSGQLKGQLDGQRLARMTTDLETMILNDPQFDSFDPFTGMPANAVDENGNKYVEQDDGSWAAQIETPTATMEYFEENNLSSPFETYDPDLFAGEGVLRQEAMNREAMDEAQARFLLSQQPGHYESSALEDPGIKDQFDEIVASDDALVDRKRWENYSMYGGEIGNQVASRIAPPTNTSKIINDPTSHLGITDVMSSGSPLSEEDRRAYSRFSLGGGDFNEVQSIGGRDFKMTKGSPNDGAPQRRQRQIQQAMARMGQGVGKQKMEARQDRARQMIGSSWDRINQAERQKFVNSLAAQNYSPYGEEMRGRQQQIYGAW